MKINRFEDIDVWKESRDCINIIYKLCSMKKFKNDYSIHDQIKRASISIMANIAEGFTRRTDKEFIQYLFISKASAAEVQSHLYIALDQGYISESDFKEIYNRLDKIQRQLSNFIKYLRSSNFETRQTRMTR